MVEYLWLKVVAIDEPKDLFDSAFRRSRDRRGFDISGSVVGLVLWDQVSDCGSRMATGRLREVM